VYCDPIWVNTGKFKFRAIAGKALTGSKTKILEAEGSGASFVEQQALGGGVLEALESII